MVFLTGMNDSAILVLLVAYLFFNTLLYFIVIGILYLLQLKSFYATWYKKILLFIVVGVLAYFVLYFNFQLTHKGLLE